METAAVVRAFPYGVPKRAPQPLRTKMGGKASPESKTTSPDPTVAVSRAMNEVFSLVSRLAPTDVTLTLTGETGTGKDVFAHLVHDLSPRAGKPFVVFDCGAVPANLVESELFGHERGAFTGAHT